MYNYKEETQDSPCICNVPSCDEAGEHRAPKNRNLVGSNSPDDYYMFCRQHAQKYNQQWDYFENMSTDEIYDWQKEATLGHRPTWKHQISAFANDEDIHNKLHSIFSEDGSSSESRKSKKAEYVPSIPDKDRKALSVLNLSHPTNKTEIKKRYKILVKKYHPDINRGDKKVEEYFKKVTEAYSYIVDNYREAYPEK